MTKAHVWNRVTIIGDAAIVKQLRNEMRMKHTTEGSLDFNKITPKPDWVECELTEPDEPNDYYDNIINERENWELKNWGVKGGARPVRRQSPIPDNAMEFHTREELVPKLISNLSRLAPECDVVYSFASEDWEKSGTYMFKNGELIEGLIHQPRSKDAVELCVALRCDGVMPEHVKWDDTTETYSY